MISPDEIEHLIRKVAASTTEANVRAVKWLRDGLLKEMREKGLDDESQVGLVEVLIQLVVNAIESVEVGDVKVVRVPPAKIVH
jgi:hypothetical protein